MSSILCIEDEVDIREVIAEELEMEGYEVFQAGDGVDGLKMILEKRPDLVLSDVTMPKMNGLELLAELRLKHAALAEMPFFLLSALADRESILKGIRLGADDYLTKPIDFDMLRAKIEAGLRQSKRMIDRKEEEHVRLYRKLTGDAANMRAKQEAPSGQKNPADRNIPKLPRLRVVLVGESGPGLWNMQRLLEGQGHDVRVYTSGRSYLDKLSERQQPVDITFLWLHSDDMQAPITCQMAAREESIKILVLPKEMAAEEQGHVVRKFADTLALPMSDEEVVGRIAWWMKEKRENRKQARENRETRNQEREIRERERGRMR